MTAWKDWPKMSAFLTGAVVLTALGCGHRVAEKNPSPPASTSGGEPLASAKFAGEWYGILTLVDSPRIIVGSSPLGDLHVNMPNEHEAYMALGGKNSRISLGTAVGGPTKNRLVEISTKILTPDHVQVKHEALLVSGNGSSLWDEAETDLALKGDTIECIETHRVSQTPHSTTYQLAKYQGTLKRLSAAEAKAMEAARKAASAEPEK
jgi:hypothetical protein